MQFTILFSFIVTLLLTARAFAMPRGVQPPSHNFKAALIRMFNLNTPYGQLNGTATAVAGIERYVVRYATAKRWKAPVAATTLNTLTSLPSVCPQLDDDGNLAGSEDCLYATVYAPPNPSQILVWIHGGSLVVGGANDPMIEGSKLAKASNAVVVVVQYRLGVLGFLSPSSGADGNLGVRDVVASLSFVGKIASAFGLSSSSVTVAGQSSGATLVRALLATPSAASLFSKAMIHSDTADYGFSKPSTLKTLQNAFFPGMLNCSTSATSCLNSLSLQKIMSAQQDIIAQAPSLDSATSGPVPLRPVFDQSLITSTLTSSFPSSLKPLLVTNVNNEGAAFIFGANGLPAGLPAEAFDAVIPQVIPDDRASAVCNSTFYQPDPNANDALRLSVSHVVGDLGFRCPDWQLARAWAQKGGKSYTGLFQLGATHPANDGIEFCTSSANNVCHQDEIPIIFGTARSPTNAQKQLIAEVQARIAAFMSTGNPNPNSSGPSQQLATQWSLTKNTQTISVLAFGGSGQVSMGACNTLFWGTPAVPFDYQIYGL